MLAAENEIVGEALIALQHDDLKSMGIASVGHRLTILKSVYDVKKAQDVPIESDHYLPLCKPALVPIRARALDPAERLTSPAADAEAQYATATLKDIKHLVEQLRLRDERMSLLEQDLRRTTEDFRRLREDMLPALRLAKDAQQPLPNVSGSSQAYTFEPTLSPPVPTPPGQGPGPGVIRSYSQRKILIGATPKGSSPTQPTHERLMEQTLDPANAAERAVMSSSHLAAMNGSAQNSAVSSAYPSPNMPSPTSPPNQLTGVTLASRSYRSDPPTPSSRTTLTDNEHANYGARDKTAGAAPLRRRETPVPDTPNTSNASVEIFKSFRVSMDDPCHKVLPAALKKYQINAPWDQYALYIVYGDQERCLGMDEKPLILFKQLDKEGKKPMFMLRRTNSAQVDGDPGSAGMSGAARGASTGYDPPGGII